MNANQIDNIQDVLNALNDIQGRETWRQFSVRVIKQDTAQVCEALLADRVKTLTPLTRYEFLRLKKNAVLYDAPYDEKCFVAWSGNGTKDYAELIYFHEAVGGKSRVCHTVFDENAFFLLVDGDDGT